MLNAQDYLSNFRRRAANCRALLELSNRQTELLNASDYAGLVELLSHKQQLIDDLLSNDHPAGTVWQMWRMDRDQLSRDERVQCDQVLAETDALLRELMALDHVSVSELSHRQDATRVALADVNAGGRAMQGYLTPNEIPVSRRLDLDL